MTGEAPVTQTGRELFRQPAQHLPALSGPGPPGTPLCAARQTEETPIYNILLMKGQNI